MADVRAIEGLAIRLKDVDFSATPTKIHIRKEYAKTKIARDIYISDEQRNTQTMDGMEI